MSHRKSNSKAARPFASLFRFILAMIAFLAFGAPLVARAENVTIDFGFAGYMRAGTGNNLKGGKQVCFNNLGSVGNEFRLGNECGTYGEASFRALMLKPKSATDPFFRSQLTLSYFPPNDSQYEDTSVVGQHDINVVEAFVSGGNIEGFPAELWAGKRFYRTVDVNMNDIFYFDNMNGIGGGIENWRLPVGKLNLALLRQSTFEQPGLPPTGFTQPSQTTVDSASAGVLGKTALDARYDIPISERLDVSAWSAAAYSPPGSATVATNIKTSTPTNTYEAGRGFVYGLYARYKFAGGFNGGTNGDTNASFNDVAVIYGTGIMQSLEMGTPYNARGGAGVVEGSGGNEASRLRVVDSISLSLTPKFSTIFAFTFEDRNSGATTDAHSRWWNVGLRPYYAISEHFALVGELGHSEVSDEADRDSASAASGNHIGARQLTRVTFAPQFAIKPDIGARPVIRCFVSHSFWNDANQHFVNGGVAGSISPTPAFASNLSGTSVGLQSEVWF